MIFNTIHHTLLGLVFAYVILSWFPAAQSHSFVQALNNVAELLLAPVRRVVKPISTNSGFMLDLSPLVFVIAVEVLFRVLSRLGIWI